MSCALEWMVVSVLVAQLVRSSPDYGYYIRMPISMSARGFVRVSGILLGTAGVLMLLTEMFEYAWER